MKKLILVMIAAILVMFLGCSKSSDSPTSPSTSSPVAGTWSMISENGSPISGFTMILVINADGTWSYTATPATGTACTGSGTSSTSGNTLTIVTTTESCPSTGTTYPNTEINTYTVTATTLTITEPTTSGGKITVFTKS